MGVMSKPMSSSWATFLGPKPLMRSRRSCQLMNYVKIHSMQTSGLPVLMPYYYACNMTGCLPVFHPAPHAAASPLRTGMYQQSDSKVQHMHGPTVGHYPTTPTHLPSLPPL